MTNNADVVWRVRRSNEPDPYQLEWNHLIDAIRNDQPYNEVQRGAEASLITAMGRMACHTGQVVTRDQMLNGDHEFAPNVDRLTLDGPAPLQAGRRRQIPGAAAGHGDAPRVLRSSERRDRAVDIDSSLGGEPREGRLWHTVDRGFNRPLTRLGSPKRAFATARGIFRNAPVPRGRLALSICL